MAIFLQSWSHGNPFGRDFSESTRLIAALALSTAAHALGLWQLAASIDTHRPGTRTLQVRLASAASEPQPLLPVVTNSPDSTAQAPTPAADGIGATPQTGSVSGTREHPRFAIPPDFSALESLDLIFPAYLVLRVHVASDGTFEGVEVRQKNYANREFVELASKQIAATPIIPARHGGVRVRGYFDVVIGTQPTGGEGEPAR